MSQSTPATPDQRAQSRKIHPAWFAAAITFFTLITTAGFRAAPSVLIIPLSESSLHFTRANISLAVSVNILVYGLTAPFAAALMGRFGIRRVVMCALMVVGLGAISTIYITKPWHLIALWGLVVGFGTGSMALVFAAMVANRWFIKRKGLVVGALTAAGATGQLIFLPVLSRLANHNWKYVSLVVGTSAIVMVPLIYLFLKESPRTAGTTPYGAPDGWVEPEVVKRSAAREAIDTLKQGLGMRDFWFLTGSFFVCGLSTNGLIGTHLIPAAHDHGMIETTAAGLLAMVGVFDVIGTLFSGWLTDRIDSRKLLFFYYFLRGLSLFLLPSILFSSIHPSTLIFIIFYGLDWVATVPPTIFLARSVFGPARGMVAYGWIFASHQIGAAVAAFGAALLRVKFGDYAISFYIAGIMCVIASYFVLQIKKPVAE